MKNTLSLGLGTAAIGRPSYINLRQEKSSNLTLAAFKQKAIDILNHAYQKNIRYFDTAPNYGFAEEILIDWLKEKNDPTIEVASKWGYTYTANFDPNAKVHEIKEHSLRQLNKQWEISKALLPHLTTYQIHSATLETGVLNDRDVLNRLYELKEQYGLKIGVTVSGINQILIIKKALDVEVKERQLIDTVQVTYNVFDQSLASITDRLEGKRIIIKEALANGRIFPSTEKYKYYNKTYKLLQKLALKYEVGIDAIALRFCMDSIDAYKVLSGASESAHLNENLQSMSFTLTDLEIDLIKRLAIQPKHYWVEREDLEWQ